MQSEHTDHAPEAGAATASKTTRLRWYCSLPTTDPHPGTFRTLLDLLPDDEQQRVLAYVQPADRQRALASRLMQRCCVSLACGVPWAHVTMSRTKGGKPFTTSPRPPGAPNFNFNVAHEGEYVVLAAEPLHIVGVDLAAPRCMRPGGAGGGARPLRDYLDHFRKQLDASEWGLVEGGLPDEARAEASFQRIWSLKEAFIKARGDGLGFQPLSRAAFAFPGADPWVAQPQLLLDGSPQPSWAFSLHALPNHHWAAVALGPPSCVVDAHGVFRSTLLQQCVPPPAPPATALGGAHVAGAAAEPRFVRVTLGGLLQQVGLGHAARGCGADVMEW